MQPNNGALHFQRTFGRNRMRSFPFDTQVEDSENCCNRRVRNIHNLERNCYD
jgi:hypothetical protein